MSFEGYYQTLCVEGHHRDFNVYGETDPTEGDALPCGHPLAWWNLVDCTNGCEEGHNGDGSCACGAVTLKPLDPGQSQYDCAKCGHHEPGWESTYAIPENVGHRASGWPLGGPTGDPT